MPRPIGMKRFQEEVLASGLAGGYNFVDGRHWTNKEGQPLPQYFAEGMAPDTWVRYFLHVRLWRVETTFGTGTASTLREANRRAQLDELRFWQEEAKKEQQQIEVTT